MQTQRTLLSEPFLIDPSKMIRETEDKFPKPILLSFDAFGTLYRPKKPVAEQYHEISSKEFGIKTSLKSITTRFPQIYKELQGEYPNYGKDSVTITNCDEWWLELIIRLFDIPHYKDDEMSSKLCNRLLNHFTGSDAYELFDDVIPALEQLHQRDIRLIISSNSDHRLLEIVKNLGLSEYFGVSINMSYDLEASKPERKFFSEIAKRYINSSSKYLDQVERYWHIGDSYEEDYVGSVKAGWNGILLDRGRNSKLFTSAAAEAKSMDACFMSKEKPTIEEGLPILIANNRVVITNLLQILKLFP